MIIKVFDGLKFSTKCSTFPQRQSTPSLCPCSGISIFANNKLLTSYFISSSHYLNLTSPLYVPLRDPRRPGLTEPRPVGEEIKLWITELYTF